MTHVFLNRPAVTPSPTGIANYASGLAMALRTAGVTVTPDCAPVAANRAPSTLWRGVSQHIRDKLPGAYRIRRLIDQYRFSNAMALQPPDIYHEPTLWPLSWPGATVMTVHDLVHIRFPETQPASRIREIEHRFKPALDRCNAIIVTSHHVHQELAELHPAVRNKIFLTPIGVDNRLFLPSSEYGQEELPFNLRNRQFFLCVGTLEPRKNIALAITAHKHLRDDMRREFPLVIAGGHEWKKTHVGDDPHIITTGYIANDMLPRFYRHARALVFPSLYEGFGMPVLEAMASGTPSIIQRGIASAEIAGSTGISVDDFSPEQWTSALTSAANNPVTPQELDTLRARAATFSWQHCASATLKAYQYALDNR